MVISDLADLSGLSSACDIFMKELDSDKYSMVIFISNAGSPSSLTYIGTGEGSDLSLISLTVNFNVTSSIYLTSDVVRRYSRSELPSSSPAPVRLINISYTVPFSLSTAGGYTAPERLQGICTTVQADDIFGLHKY